MFVPIFDNMLVPVYLPLVIQYCIYAMDGIKCSLRIFDVVQFVTVIPGYHFLVFNPLSKKAGIIVSKLCMLNSSDSSLTWETATWCPPLIHNQPSNTPLPQWFNCPICHGCCSHQNKRRNNDRFQSPTRHAAFHSWSDVFEKPNLFTDGYFIISYVSPFLFCLLTPTIFY